ncbi:mannose/cellobiose epimerase-like protein (N-acyl-D-glucosamine 2-epimerase family) (plasmid) [Ensifer sp. WSM1721]|uniref:AGE family epimerase/isomerase n=1 Tax=Ensifer sp. WSM1721 TaxID=1041159 RepID=UPI0004794192|nr:AGE family epimerase/isomerase [Ensifer sp. WSM1721]
MLDVIIGWLNDHAIPRMANEGTDWLKGGYAERFDWSGKRFDPGFKRVRVTARQIYAFSHAALGGAPEALRAAEHGMQFLLRKAKLSNGLFASKLSTDGTCLDATADLYDLAFVLFALAWWYRLTDDAAALRVAEETLSALRRELRHPSQRGFLHRSGEGAPYQQNPHMHLLEASIFLAAFSDRDIFHTLARELFDLAAGTFFDPETETLAEFYGEGWRRPDDSGSVIVEPGHHFEWCWLLSRYTALTGDKSALGIAEKLFSFAERHGFDTETGLILDAVDTAGRVLKADFRSWPNLEYVKAIVAMQEIYPNDDRFSDERLDEAVQRVFTYFLRPKRSEKASVPEGLWVDYLHGKDFSPKVDHIPVSTFYHLSFAFMEVTRRRTGRDMFSGLPW